jgi:hypothetical protein
LTDTFAPTEAVIMSVTQPPIGTGYNGDPVGQSYTTPAVAVDVSEVIAVANLGPLDTESATLTAFGVHTAANSGGTSLGTVTVPAGGAGSPVLVADTANYPYVYFEVASNTAGHPMLALSFTATAVPTNQNGAGGGGPGPYVPLASVGVANGVASLNGSAQVPLAELPVVLSQITYSGHYGGVAPAIAAAQNGDNALDLDTGMVFTNTAGVFAYSGVTFVIAPASSPIIATAGTPVTQQAITAVSYSLVMTGIVSGQPILLANFNTVGALTGTPIVDTFATPYTWTKIDGAYNAGLVRSEELWIGTGGVGNGGTITVTQPSAGHAAGAAIPLTNATTKTALNAISQKTSAGWNGGGSATGFDTTTTGGNLVASAIGELYIVIVVCDQVITPPASPWATTLLELTTTNCCLIATLSNPAPGWATPDPASGVSTPKGICAVGTFAAASGFDGSQAIVRYLGG